MSRLQVDELDIEVAADSAEPGHGMARIGRGDVSASDVGDVCERGVPDPVRADIQRFTPCGALVEPVEEVGEVAPGDWTVSGAAKHSVRGRARAPRRCEGDDHFGERGAEGDLMDDAELLAQSDPSS